MFSSPRRRPASLYSPFDFDDDAVSSPLQSPEDFDDMSLPDLVHSPTSSPTSTICEVSVIGVASKMNTGLTLFPEPISAIEAVINNQHRRLRV